MIVMPEFVSSAIKAMDHAGVEIGNEELLMRRVKSKVAKRRRGIGHAGEHDLGEQTDDARLAVDLEDASRIALQLQTELSLHPSLAGAPQLCARWLAVRATADELQTECGCRRER